MTPITTSLARSLSPQELRAANPEPLRTHLQFERFDERFLEKSWEWLNDPEIKRLTMTPDFTREEQSRWFARLQEMNDYRIWGVSLDEVPVGAAGLKKLTKENGEYWGYIGERRYWGLGLGRQIVGFVLDQARALKLKKVFLHVHRDNFRALALYASTGFQVRGEVNEVLEMNVSL
jgi:RimJ/RimL family protein N-acetyltransferase